MNKQQIIDLFWGKTYPDKEIKNKSEIILELAEDIISEMELLSQAVESELASMLNISRGEANYLYKYLMAIYNVCQNSDKTLPIFSGYIEFTDGTKSFLYT